MPPRKARPGDVPGILTRFTRSVTTASAAAVVLAALFAGLSGTAGAYAATPGSAAPAGTGWHRLSLIDGWKSDAVLGTGRPSWTVKGGVVYLSGSIHQVSGNSVSFAKLPPAARPARLALIPVYTFGDTNGWLEIYPTGDIYANSSLYANAQDYTSLAGVSFPAASATRHPLHLLNGWQRSTGYWDLPPSDTISGGMAYLFGALRQPSGTAATFAVLPKAARPAHVEYITVASFGGVPAVLRIYPGGQAAAYGGGAQSLLWLGGVSFPQAATMSHILALHNGWTSGQSKYHTGDPAYSVISGVVHLSGSLIQPSAGAAAFATLPRGARPAHSLYIKAYTYNGSVGTLYIQPNGTMQAYSPTSSDAAAFTSLAAISFPVGS